MRTASWVIVDKVTRKAVLETFSADVAQAVNAAKYEAVPILQYLNALNRSIKDEAVSLI